MRAKVNQLIERATLDGIHQRADVHGGTGEAAQELHLWKTV